MELTNEFRVEVPIDHAWHTLTDVERIAPCLPGAQLQEIEGDEYRGIVKVKVGPITAQYKGVARFLERDDVNHRAVLRAEGRETRGQGNAAATITADLAPDGDGTRVTVLTDLHVTGRVAQFGRGVLAEVSAKLLDQFVDQLHDTVLKAEEPVAELEPAAGPSGALEPGAGPAGQLGAAPPPSGALGSAAPPSAVRRIDHPEVEPVDLVGAAGASVAKRLVPAAIVALLLVLLFGARWRRRRHQRGCRR
ncbi:MAG: SRPBCC family protein [Acidimicrobiales bacterium]|nr:SRPBCC family protein [Acidimicrobiales bacterium]